MLTMELAWSLLLLRGRKWRKIIHLRTAAVAAHRVVAEWAGPLPETKILFISLNVVEHWRIHVLRKRGKAQKVMRSGFWQWQPPLDRHVTKSGLMLLPWALSVCWPALLSPRSHIYAYPYTTIANVRLPAICRTTFDLWKNLTAFSWKQLVFVYKNCTLLKAECVF